MGCVALSQAHRVMGGEAEKRLQKNQEHGGENWRVWNNTYWERTWKKIENVGVPFTLAEAWAVLPWVTSTLGRTVHATRKTFFTTLQVSTLPLQPALPLQSRLQSLNHFFVLFIQWSWAQMTLSSTQPPVFEVVCFFSATLCTICYIFRGILSSELRRKRKGLREREKAKEKRQKRKGLKTTQENIWGLSFP